MKEILQQTRIFLILFVFYLLIPGIALLLTAKGDFEIWLNSFHTTSFDNFFYWVTYFGDGIFAALVLVCIVLFVNIRQGLLITIILLTVSTVTQILKLFVFQRSERPLAYFKDTIELHFVPDLEIHSSNSFPSGHTTQAFCMFFLFSFFVKNKSYQYLFFVIACLAAVSRTYLLQHFLMDIYVGAIIGTIGSFICLYIAEQKNLLSNQALNKPLINIR
ncbi:phosphatase PAP2 family protein [Cytophaga aurantiaca]|uniref:phosphatase PAP2 family protein n=1 Tax=Cytophaga aurantiaca TaxID=29530 RepID=UPI000368BBB2|nr:phosphatase PAP2 family protein [Cytophaga aurantiaca]